MAFENRITPSELNSKGATTLPNQPKMTAQALKQEFDAPAKEICAPKHNGLIDELEAETAAANIGAVDADEVATTVQAMLDGIEAEVATKGDMKSEEYDPESVVLDAGGLVSYISTAIVNKVERSELATVAFSGEFSDLNNAPNVDGKADKVASATSGNFAGLDSNGNLTDSGSKASDFLTEHQDITGKMNVDGSNADSSLAFGALTVGSRLTGSISGARSLGVGQEVVARGASSFAEGVATVASGAGAHAEGDETTASGDYAHAEGYLTVASGDFSHAGGNQTEAGYAFQTVVGKYNDNQSDTLFEVGNGTADDARSNALEVYTDGISQDGGTTKYKFTQYNGNDGYYDKNGTFHAFGSGGGGTGDMSSSDYDSDSSVYNAGGIKPFVTSMISTAIVSALTASY